MIDPRVLSICEEYGVRVIAGHRYPDVGETRAVSTLNRILKKYGEKHLRDILHTAASTENNKACLESNFIWCCSDLLVEYRDLYKFSATRWLEVFDAAPIGPFLWLIRGQRQQRFLLKGFMTERIVRAYADQPDLFHWREVNDILRDPGAVHRRGAD
jgi:hypothetical protein